jgi:4-hydroxy-3-methylbut-2-en-1-yl diphosphate synthase IspG/GcpE
MTGTELLPGQNASGQSRRTYWLYTFSCPTCGRQGQGGFSCSEPMPPAYLKKSALTGARWTVCPTCGPMPKDATAEDLHLGIGIGG